jgi:hypothetical protein
MWFERTEGNLGIGSRRAKPVPQASEAAKGSEKRSKAPGRGVRQVQGGTRQDDVTLREPWLQISSHRSEVQPNE